MVGSMTRNLIIKVVAVAACLYYAATFSRAGAGEVAPAAPTGKKPNAGYMLIRPSDGNINLAKGILTSKSIAGVSLRDRWINVEREPGVYNFERLKLAAMKCRQSGKVYTILVESGAQSPLWLKAHGCATVKISPQQHDQTNQVPVPWDPVFLKRYKALVTALGKEFDSDPYCVKVVAGGPTRRSNELNLGGRNSFPAFARLPNADINFESAWYDCLDFYYEAFPSTPISLQLGVSFAGKQTTERIAKYHAAELGFERACFEWCSLNAKPGATDYLPYVLTATYCGRGYKGGAEQVQATTFTDEYGGSGSRQQNFDYSRDRLKKMGGDYMVIYEPDIPLLKGRFIPR
jgi:hypothetical protein